MDTERKPPHRSTTSKNAFLAPRVLGLGAKVFEFHSYAETQNRKHNTQQDKTTTTTIRAKQFAIEKRLQPSHSQYPIAIYLTSFADSAMQAPAAQAAAPAHQQQQRCARSCTHAGIAHALNYTESNDVRALACLFAHPLRALC